MSPIPLGFARAIARSPFAWTLALALVTACPLCSLLSPFSGAGLDALRSLLWSWSPLAAVVGASLAIAYLSKSAAFLGQLAPRTRWGGELGTLLVATLGAQIILLIGAVGWAQVSSAEHPLDLWAWVLACLGLDVHLSALGILILRVPTPLSLRLTSWYAVLLVGPEVITRERMPMPLDIARHLGDVEGRKEPAELFATVLMCSGLLGLGALGCWRRASSREQAGITT